MDNHTKLQQLKLRDVYYYNRFSDGSRITSCLLLGEEGTVLSRGVAICNPFDNFIKKKGRAMACGRAVKALEANDSCLPVSPVSKGLRRYNAALFWYMGEYKATYLPKLNTYETELVGSVTKEKVAV